MRYLIPFCTLQKGIRYLLDLNPKQKGQITLSNNVTSVFACALHETSLYLSLKIKEKLWKYRKKMFLSGLELRLQNCLRNLRIACKAVQVAMPLGQLKLEKLNLFTIYEPFTHQWLRPIQSYHFQSNLIWCDGTCKLVPVLRLGMIVAEKVSDTCRYSWSWKRRVRTGGWAAGEEEPTWRARHHTSSRSLSQAGTQSGFFAIYIR